MKKGNPKGDLLRASASNAMMAFPLAARSTSVALVVLVVHRPSSIHLVCKANSPLNPKAHLSPPLFLPLARSIRSPPLHFPSALSFPLPSLSLPMFPDALSPLPLPSRRATSPSRRRGRCGVKTDEEEEEEEAAAASLRRRPTTALFSRSLARPRSLSSSRHPSVAQRGRDPGCRPRSKMHGEGVSQ